jgi:hypothetical protein
MRSTRRPLFGKSAVRERARGSRHAWAPGALLLVIAMLYADNAFGQARQERGGIVLCWGLVPAAIAADRAPCRTVARRAAARWRSGSPSRRRAVDAASGHRITDAVVRAQLRETGFVDAPAKVLTPMPVTGQMSYGQMFSVVKDGPYAFTCS